MARVGDEVTNEHTGQHVRFCATAAETDGKSLRIETFDPPHGPREAEHLHPRQESWARVLDGSMGFRVAGRERSLGPGEEITIPAGSVHQSWNDGDAVAHMCYEFRPALHTDALIETLAALAQRGELDDRGMPSFLQTMAMVSEFGDELHLARPPWLILQALAAVLAPIARRKGLRGRHVPRYMPV